MLRPIVTVIEARKTPLARGEGFTMPGPWEILNVCNTDAAAQQVVADLRSRPGLSQLLEFKTTPYEVK